MLEPEFESRTLCFLTSTHVPDSYVGLKNTQGCPFLEMSQVLVMSEATVTVLVSLDYQKKLPQSRRFKTTNMYFLTVLEGRSLEIKVLAGPCSL